MNETRKLRVFLCHSSQDKPIVRELYQRLNAEGWIDPWLDEERLLPGQDWGMEIENAVEVADAVIVFLSNASVTQDGYVHRELKYALDVALEKPDGVVFIIPLRLDNCQVPRRIRGWQWVDLFPKKKKFNLAYEKIVIALNNRYNKLLENENPNGAKYIKSKKKKKIAKIGGVNIYEEESFLTSDLNSNNQ